MFIGLALALGTGPARNPLFLASEGGQILVDEDGFPLLGDAR